MENESEVLGTQPEDQEEAKVLTPEEIEELQRRAEVSSQNFERAKKAELEAKELRERVSSLETQVSPIYTTDDDLLRNEIAELKQKFASIEEDKKLSDIYQRYPAVSDKRAEFDAYRVQYPTGNLDAVAKLFLAEFDLLTDAPKRKGLEKAGGGKKVAPDTGKMLSADVKNLRENNFKEYMKLVRQGRIKVSD
jgi:hypothetical protein